MRGEIYQRDDGRWEFRVVARNGQTVATSHRQGYSRRADCVRSLQRLLQVPWPGDWAQVAAP